MKSSSSTNDAWVGDTGLGELRISRTDRNRHRSCTKPKRHNGVLQQTISMPHLITSPDDLPLTAITTSRVLLAAIMLDDKSLRVINLDKVVWMLVRRDPSTGMSIINEEKITVTHAKHCAHVS